MFETKKLTKEKIEQRRAERKAIKRKSRNAPQNYSVCLEVNSNQKQLSFKRLFRKRRYYAKKMFFTIAAKLGIVEEQQKRKPTNNREKF